MSIEHSAVELTLEIIFEIMHDRRRGTEKSEMKDNVTFTAGKIRQ